jgi:hypothetical protein
MIITTVIVLVVVGAVVAVLFLAAFLIDVCDEADHQMEMTRINRERRLAEARINRLTSSAIQQMTEAAAPHSVCCQCVRCAGRGGQR